MLRSRVRGLTLIELLVTLTLVGIMLMLAIPGYGAWTRDARVRTVSEELANAMRLAQAEAVARNRQVALVRTNARPALNAVPAINGRNWYAQVLPLNSEEAADAAFLDSAYISGGSYTANDGATVSGNAIVCFNSVGRLVNRADTGLIATPCVAPTSATDPLDFNVQLASSTFGTAATAMRVELFLGGRSRLCNANAAAAQPNACTP